MQTEEIAYSSGNKNLKGFLCHARGIQGKRPAVIIAHTWRGLDAFEKKKAEELARMGYIAFAADVYGAAQPAQDNEEAEKRMKPLFLDRPLLQERIKAALDVVEKHPLVDSTKIGAIGFCFGGLTVIELFRSGAPLKGVVSFHGVLSNKMAGHSVKLASSLEKQKGSILILHGHNDPLVSREDIDDIHKELTDAKVDWQMLHYGHTSHAFTNPNASDAVAGLIYNERADRRSWVAMRDFFDEVFKF